MVRLRIGIGGTGEKSNEHNIETIMTEHITRFTQFLCGSIEAIRGMWRVIQHMKIYINVVKKLRK